MLNRAKTTFLIVLFLTLFLGASPIHQYVKPKSNQTAPSKRFIITGGPGTGKTTIVNYLHQLGYKTAREAATDLIRDDLAKHVVAPWSERDFNQRVALLQEKRQEELLKGGVAFFDRSPIDALTYELMYDFEPTEELLRVVQKTLDEDFYHNKVFLIEDLGACLKTEIRAETLEESRSIETILEKSYQDLGFKVIRVPAASVKERVAKILESID
ncbi:MAG: ATPase [Chlamydiae bacterium]|nr:ATPase [Chlamydiota bacterium]